MSERSLQGVGAAPGVAFGRAVVLDRLGPAESRVVPVSARPAELEVARHALEAVAAELSAIAAHLAETGRDQEAAIVETSVLMSADPVLTNEVESLITTSGMPAPDALRQAADRFRASLSSLPDPTLALRADDVSSLGRRAAARAKGVTRAMSGGVLVASSLGPADVAELEPSGVALAGGGITAHAAIVARSLGLPMVVALGPEVLEIEDGEEIVLDGDRGELVRRPAASRVATVMSETKSRRDAREAAVARRLEPATTADGHTVTVLANASTSAEVREGLDQGAEGVGLVRTELPFLDATEWPSASLQASQLGLILPMLSGHVATVRLFDFGGDKTPPFLRGTAERGIALLLEHPAVLRAHLASIVRASGAARLRLLVPMVTRVDQLREVRDVLQSVLDGRAAPLLGSMIETPEAAEGADEIASESDFLSIGTNDLTQLALGLDREHSRTAPVLDVRVLRLIASAIDAAKRARIPVDVCGEAASDGAAMPILVGLGVDELSVAAARVGEVRQRIRELDFVSSRRAAQALLDEPRHARRQ